MADKFAVEFRVLLSAMKYTPPTPTAAMGAATTAILVEFADEVGRQVATRFVSVDAEANYCE